MIPMLNRQVDLQTLISMAHGGCVVAVCLCMGQGFLAMGVLAAMCYRQPHATHEVPFQEEHALRAEHAVSRDAAIDA